MSNLCSEPVITRRAFLTACGFALCSMSSGAGLYAAPPPLALQWHQLPMLPDPLGWAGCFAGGSQGALIVAGGANFPDKMPWAGGRKVWADTVFVLEKPDGPWRLAGRLPRSLGYGVAVTTPAGVVCVGGSDAERHYADAFRLALEDGKLVNEPLPPLPIPLANMSGALAGEVLYVAGGTEMPGEHGATRRCFTLDCRGKPSAWREVESFPGSPRLLATAAAHEGAFYLFGGVALERNAEGRAARVYLRETLRYRPGQGWARLANLPKPNAAAPSPAPVVEGRALLLAGDDGSRAGFQPPEQHPGFPAGILSYEFQTDRWREAGATPAPRATVPGVEWHDGFVIPSGEVRPGVRSPEVWTMKPSR